MILFDLVVHVGTLGSMAVVFRRSIRGFFRRLGGELRGEHPGDHLSTRLLVLGLGAVVVTGVIGFPLRNLFAEVFARPTAIAGTLT
jgi:undecaprenyl-diphosphatase